MNFLKSIFGYVTYSIEGSEVAKSSFSSGVAVARVAYMAAGFFATQKIKAVGDLMTKVNFLRKKKN